MLSSEAETEVLPLSAWKAESSEDQSDVAVVVSPELIALESEESRLEIFVLLLVVLLLLLVMLEEDFFLEEADAVLKYEAAEEELTLVILMGGGG